MTAKNLVREELDGLVARQESAAMKAAVERSVFSSAASSLLHSWTASAVVDGRVAVAQISLRADVKVYDLCDLPAPADVVMAECDDEVKEARAALEQAERRRSQLVEAREKTEG